MVAKSVVQKRSAKTVAKPAKPLLKIAVLTLNRSRVVLSRRAEPWAFLYRICGMEVSAVIEAQSGILED